jgi:hypothetical protein
MKNTHSVIYIVIMATLLASLAPTWAGVTDDIAPCIIFLKQDVPEGAKAKAGSGFLVNKNDSPCLITAAHVANDVGITFKIVMPGAEGRAVTGKIEGAQWHISQSADVALTFINTNNQEERNRLLKRCMPANLIAARPLPPSREIPLTVMGYPLGLGATGFVSPLSLETRAASGFITLERFDNKKLATFIILQDPSIGGLSGGPVFDTGKSYFEGRAMAVRSGVSLVGIVHGVISDNTGGKLAAVVPATEITKLLESSGFQNSR